MEVLPICKGGEMMLRIMNFKRNNKTFNVQQSTTSTRRRRRKLANLLHTILSFKNYLFKMVPPNPLSELDVAATKLQKFYRSYRTRRNLADCAVVCEELWWKASEFASESAFSRWERARKMADEEGQGLPKDDRAQKLAIRHWLEAIDPRHRYGHNLNFYYDVWFWCQSSQPFFFWLDIGDGKGVDLEVCPRKDLQRQRIKYLGPEEREAYAVIVEGGRLVYKQSKKHVHTTEGDKWIFVLSSARVLYVGQKKKGEFQHSSFLAGAATISSGRLVAHHGVLHAIWPYSGHYRPTAKNFREFIYFLEDHDVDLTNVKKYPVDDDVPLCKSAYEEHTEESNVGSSDHSATTTSNNNNNNLLGSKNMVMPMASEWSTGVGPRIGCMIKYSIKLQVEALEQLNLTNSEKVNHNHGSSSSSSNAPITFLRPSMKVFLSPGLVDMDMGLPTLNLHVGIFKAQNFRK